METPKKMAFVFGAVTLTLTPDDVEAVYTEFEQRTGKKAREMRAEEKNGRLRAALKPFAEAARSFAPYPAEQSEATVEVSLTLAQLRAAADVLGQGTS